MMSRKDYIRAAEIIRLDHQGDADITQAFVDFFKGDNPRFDEGRFRTAAGYRSNPGKFADPMEEVLYHGFDQQIGSIGEMGWYGLISGMTKAEAREIAADNDIELTDDDLEDSDWPLNAIISEDTDGFIDVSYFPGDNRGAMKEWRSIEQRYEEYYEGEE